MKRLLQLVLATSVLVAGVVNAEDRLISIDGAITEIIYAIGAEKSLVAVDTTSTRPDSAKELPNVGYMRALSSEALLSLKPTKVIASKDAGPKAVFEHLEQSGVDVNIIDAPYSVEGLKQRVKKVAELTNKVKQGEKLIATIDDQLTPLSSILEKKLDGGKEKSPSVLFLMGMQANQLMAAGKGTQAAALINTLNASNLMSDYHGYKPMSIESIVTLDPDVIVIVNSNPAAKVPDGINMTRAARAGKLLVAKVDDLLGFGPRLPTALQTLANVIYQEK